MVGYAGSPTYTAYVDMTLTRSKVKVTRLLNFRQLAKPCMLAAMTAAPFRGFLVINTPTNLGKLIKHTSWKKISWEVEIGMITYTAGGMVYLNC